MQSIYILWLRELKRYYRSRARIVGALGQPLLFLIALGFGLGPIFHKAGQGNYFQFLAPGVIAMGILFTAVFSGVQVIWDRQFGFLRETLVAPVARWQIMLGKTLGGTTVSTLQGCIVLVLACLFGFRPDNYALLPVAVLFMFLIGLFFTALGTAFACFLNDMQGFQLIMNFVVQPVFFLSGALFPLSGLPKFLAIITAVDPLAYGVDGLRGALSNNAQYPFSIDFIVLLLLAFAALSLGSYLFSKTQA